jgi:putative hydrolase of the HAD superfamily
VLAEAGIVAEASAVARAYDDVGEGLEALWTTLQDAGPEAQVTMLLDRLGVADRVRGREPLVRALVDAYGRPILDALPVANEGARETLATLRDGGLRLALVCNTGRTPGRMLRLVLERLGLARYLSVLTFSDEVGLRKPHPEIFRRTLAGLGVAPEEAAHVGDNLAADVAGARGIGMRGIHLCPGAVAGRRAADADTVARLSELPALLDSRISGAPPR